MRTLTCTALLALVACKQGDDADTVPPDDSGTETTHTGTTLLDSAWPVGDIGNLHVATHVNTGRTEVMGLFLDSSAGFVNMAQCTLFEQYPCIGALPALEAFIELDPDQRVDPEVVRTRFLGFELEYGPYLLPYAEDRRTGLSGYYLDATAQGYTTGPIGARWEGQWEPRRSRDDLVVSPEIDLQSPRPGSRLFVTNGTRLPIEWVPTGAGEVTLHVATRFTLSRLYHLEDDGYFELDVDALGLTGQLEDLTLTLTRWDMADVQWTGHYARMVASSDVNFSMELANVGTREEMYVVDSCAQAGGMPPLTTGDWWGRIDGFDSSMQPSGYPSCLTESGNYYASAWGREGLAKVELPPRSVINFEYTQFSESASVYFLADCSRGNTCEAGIDADSAPGVPEVLSLANKSDDLETWYLVLDTSNESSTESDVFTLDVTIESLLDPEMYDLCVDSEAAADLTLTTASYYEEFVAYTADLDPGLGGCTSKAAPGAEAVIPFELPAYGTITATVEMEGGNPSIYILQGCQTFGCVQGSDTSLGDDPETVIYTNPTNAPQRLNLVVDSSSAGLRPFVLAVNFL